MNDRVTTGWTPAVPPEGVGDVVRLATGLAALMATFLGVWSFCYKRHHGFKLDERQKDIADCARRLVICQLTDIKKPADGTYIERVAERKQLSRALKLSESSPIVVFGPRGCGKSTLVEHTLKDRNGVVQLSISSRTTEGATNELLRKLSFFLQPREGVVDSEFIQLVFMFCKKYHEVDPVVVVAMDATTTGDVFGHVIAECKDLVYARSCGRFIVDLSGSKAATTSSVDVGNLRAVGIHIGNLDEKTEASSYVQARVPERFKNIMLEIEAKILELFDPNVLQLQRACKAVKDSETVKDAFRALGKINLREMQLADASWVNFSTALATALEGKIDLTMSDQYDFSKWLLKELGTASESRLTLVDIVKYWQNKSSKILTSFSTHDVARFNAEVRRHPFDIDPFQSDLVRLSGKHIRQVLINLPRPLEQHEQQGQ